MTVNTTELAVPTRPADPEYDRLARLGTWLAAAESGSNTPEAKGATAALRMYYARELGLPPLAALELFPSNGRIIISSKLLRALAARHGYRVVKVKSTAETCTAILVVIETGIEIGQATYTIQEAKAAGLVREKSAWKTHPARMLWARASKFVLDDYAPEVTLGIYTEEEGAEIEGVAAVLPDDDFGPAPATAIDEEDIPWPAPDELEPALDPSAFPPAPDDEEGEGGPP